MAVYNWIAPLLLSARSEDGIPCARVNGLKMYMDPDENASRAASFLWNQYEPATTAVVMEVVSDGDRIVDVGAHWGYFTLVRLALRRAWPRLCLRASPQNFALLKKHIKANGLSNVVTVQKAVSNWAGSTKLFQARSTASHSMLSLQPELTAEGGSANESIAVDTVALDDYFAAKLC